MRKQAKELVVGRVYVDLETNYVKPFFFRFIGMSDKNRPQFTRVKGTGYRQDENGIIEFALGLAWYELTPEDENELNLTPSEPTFPLSDIQRVIERIKKEANFITDNDDISDRRWRRGMREAIEIMREELKLK